MRPDKLRRFLSNAARHKIPVCIEIGAVDIQAFQDSEPRTVPEREACGYVAAIGSEGCYLLGDPEHIDFSDVTWIGFDLAQREAA